MTDARDLAFTPALDQAELVRTGVVSPVELVDVYLARIETLNPTINAYITVAGEYARAAARAAERALGTRDEALPPFHGVPISVKDLADTAGIVSTHGTAQWRDRVPASDDEVVARLKGAGFVILGKTVVPEFGPLNVSEPPGYPPGRNPWDPSRSCGGSSGGAAAALAAGLCPVSHGSDGGGSIRNPAAWCGVFGIKPSRGRVSAAPAPPQLFAINGPLARTVADGAALLDAMAGPATGDAWWAPPTTPFLDEARADPGRLRVAFHQHPGVERDATAPGCRQVVEDTAALLEELGHTVFEREPPTFGPDMLAVTSIVFAASHAAHEDARPPLDTQDPWMKTLTELGRTVAATDYINALETLQSRSRDAVAFFDDVDVFMCPTVAEPPPLVGALRDAGIEQMPRFFAMTPFTALWNTTGQPAVSLPLALDDDGLPVGLQLVGRPADEATLVRLSAQLEQARPWHDRRPPVS